MTRETRERKYSLDPEDRYLPRWEAQNRVLYRLDNDKDFREGLTRDVSCSGVCLSVDQDFLPNQTVRLTLHLSPEVSVTVTGSVAWSKVGEDEKLVGIRFSNVSEAVQDIILEHAFEMDPQKVSDQWFKEWE